MVLGGLGKKGKRNFIPADTPPKKRNADYYRITSCRQGKMASGTTTKIRKSEQVRGTRRIAGDLRRKERRPSKTGLSVFGGTSKTFSKLYEGVCTEFGKMKSGEGRVQEEVSEVQPEEEFGKENLEKRVTKACGGKQRGRTTL